MQNGVKIWDISEIWNEWTSRKILHYQV